MRFGRELETGKDTCQLGRALKVADALGLALAITSRDEATT